MMVKSKIIKVILLCSLVFVSFSVIGCSVGKQNKEITSTLYQSGDLKAMYELIHKAIPTEGNIAEYSNDLIEATMYINLYVYNSEKLEAQEDFVELTMDEIKEYLSNGEITLDYLNSNWDLPYLEKIEYGMSDRIKDYFEWYWGEGAYETSGNGTSGSQKIEDYTNQLQRVINDLCEDNPGEIAMRTVYEMNIQQLSILINCNGDASAIKEEDLSLFK